MKNDHDLSLRQHLLELLKGGSAHARIEEVISGIPARMRGQKPAGLPHSSWMLLEHMRIAQWDILEFSRNRKHVSPDWPKGYWPRTEAPPSSAAWNASIKKFRQDLKAMENLVANPKTDLHARIPWGSGQTILREALLIADHNAYHLAQLVDIRRLLGSLAGKVACGVEHIHAHRRVRGSIFTCVSPGRFRKTALTPSRQRSSIPTTTHSIPGEM
jgi:hypothetical protein